MRWLDRYRDMPPHFGVHAFVMCWLGLSAVVVGCALKALEAGCR